MDSGEMLNCLTDLDPLIGMTPLVTVDTAPQSKVVMIGAANGLIHVKNLIVTISTSQAEEEMLAFTRQHEEHQDRTRKKKVFDDSIVTESDS